MAAVAREGSPSTATTPPPVIAKAGRYTVFLTPKPSDGHVETTSPKPSSSPPSPSSTSSKRPALVQVPPPQFHEDPKGNSSGSLAFFWNAVAKVRHAHSNLDEFLADWFGLDRSKYQWALNDYYESHGMDKNGLKQKEVASKV